MKDMLFTNEGNLITPKKFDQISIYRNGNHVKVARKEYAICVLSLHEAGATFCYVDKCGFGVYCQNSRSYGVLKYINIAVHVLINW